MIEMMLEAERALAVGLLDQADRLYAQVVAADPRNAIAIVGLARVAVERGDQRGAYNQARRALAIDPDNPMARHLAMRMGELMRARGEPLPTEPAGPSRPADATRTGEAMRPAAGAAGDTPRPAPPGAPGTPAGARQPGLVDRLLRRRSR